MPKKDTNTSQPLTPQPSGRSHQAYWDNQGDQQKSLTTGFGPISGTVLTILAFLVSQLVLAAGIGLYAVVVGSGEDFFETLTESNFNNFLIAAGFSIIQLAIVWLLLRLKRRTLRSIGLTKPVLGDIFRAVTLWAGYMVAIIGATLVLEASNTGIDLEQQQQIDFTPASTQPELLLIFVSLVVLPAFVEEVLMRGFLFRSLRSGSGYWTSALGFSLLFAFSLTQIASENLTLIIGTIVSYILSSFFSGINYAAGSPFLFLDALILGLFIFFVFYYLGRQKESGPAKYFYTMLQRFGSGYWLSSIIVSVLFGLAHTQFGSGEPLLWIAFVDTFVLSMILCYAVDRYKTLWPAIGVHAIKNGIAFINLFVIIG